jgi:hypothetical protein
MKRLLGEQPDARPIDGPATTSAGKIALAGKNKDLQRSSTAAEVARIHATARDQKLGGGLGDLDARRDAAKPTNRRRITSFHPSPTTQKCADCYRM